MPSDATPDLFAALSPTLLRPQPKSASEPEYKPYKPTPWYDGLDPQQRRLVELYVETNNQTTSALTAGYGRNYQSAASLATRLFKKSKIRNAVERLSAEIMARLNFTPDRIIKEFSSIAAVEGVTVDAKAKLKALTELAKLARMYPAERTELTGADGGPIQTANLHVHRADIEGLEPEQREQLRSVLLALKAKADTNP